MTLKKLKAACKAHLFFLSKVDRRNWELYSISRELNEADEDQALRVEIVELTWRLRKALKKFYEPKLGRLLVKEELDR